MLGIESWVDSGVLRVNGFGVVGVVEVFAERVAGIDIGKATLKACVRVPAGHGRRGFRQEVRTFTTTTGALLQLAAWLEQERVTLVGMESTGQYWRPVYYVLENQFQCWLVNPAHIKKVPGRKSDVSDAVWIAQLVQHGLVRPSFVPPPPIRQLRDLTRLRTALVRDRVRHVQRIQDVLEDAGIKLSVVASDIMGVSGRAMIRALINGQDGPADMADLARGRMRAKTADLTDALTGRFSAHHGLQCQVLLTQIDTLNTAITELDTRIEAMITTEIEAQMHTTSHNSSGSGGSDSGSGGSGGGGGGGGGSGGGGSGGGGGGGGGSGGGGGGGGGSGGGGGGGGGQGPVRLHDLAQLRDLLTTIPGVGRRTAEILIAETGADMSRFATAADLSSWAAMCPGQNESAGKHANTRTRKGNTYLRGALGEAAQAAARTKNTYLAERHHRLARRRGQKRAVVATGRHILEIAYVIMKDRVPYTDLGPDHYTQHRRDPARRILQLLHELTALGYTPATS